MNKEAILIAGPTASGKTGASIKIGKQVNGLVINTDSMQVYDILSVVTARPNKEEMEDIPHLLFGHVDPSVSYSTAKWIKDVETVLCDLRGRVPIFVGGTGLYFKALLEGLSPLPDIDPDIRNKWRAESERVEPVKLHAILQEIDPIAAQKLNHGDTQRLVRALEVVESTGKSLLEWQGMGNKKPLLDAQACKKYMIIPDREWLNDRIALRFDLMVEQGAIEEVEQLLSLELDHTCPAMRAIGVKQLAGYCTGDYTLEEAKNLAVIASRQYAKRQSTWFRNQFNQDWLQVNTSNILL